ncbi:MAG: RNA polymerase subunit sigma-24 [Verrucomicrobiales bacterium]|nr:RNA polymerase subunit sigma-24 [Verrucomicrobiales bacterium]
MQKQRDNKWHEWLEANLDRFLLFARQQTRSESDAEDVLQESLIESWKRAGESAPKSVAVFATIRRRAIDLGRSTTRRTQRELATGPEARWFEPRFEQREETRLLENAIHELPAQYGEVLTLKNWGGLTFREISETLDIPLNTAASRHRYALDELRKALKGVLR